MTRKDEISGIARIRRRVLDILIEADFEPQRTYPTNPDLLPCQQEISIWNDVQAWVKDSLRGPAPPDYMRHTELSNNLFRLLSFGHFIAGLFHNRFGGDTILKKPVQRLGAVFNTAICCIDRMWDVETKYRSSIEKLLKEENVVAALNSPFPNHPFFSKGNNDQTPVLPSFTCWALDTYVMGLSSLRPISPQWKKNRQELSTSIITLLRAVKRSDELRIKHPVPNREVSEILPEIGSGPFRILAQTSLFSCLECNRTDWNRFSEDGFRIGDIFRWTDDLSDASYDLSKGIWNSVWVAFSDRGGVMMNEQGHLRPNSELLTELLDSGTIELITSQILRKATVLEEAEAHEVASWVHAWLL